MMIHLIIKMVMNIIMMKKMTMTMKYVLTKDLSKNQFCSFF
jgi:hypothetical protein